MGSHPNHPPDAQARPQPAAAPRQSDPPGGQTPRANRAISPSLRPHAQSIGRSPRAPTSKIRAPRPTARPETPPEPLRPGAEPAYAGYHHPPSTTKSCALHIRLSSLPKGDAVAVARLAGIQAAKRTDEWIPLAHTLPLDSVEVTIEPGNSEVRIASRVTVTARTGAEMEALVACAAAALAMYDMVKAIDRSAVVTDLRLEAKSGGRSGDFRRDSDESSGS